MSAYHGALTFERNGIFETILLSYCPTPVALQQFAQAIDPYTTAAITQQDWVQTDDLTLGEGSGQVDDPGVMLRAKLQNQASPSEYKFFHLPAPVLTNFDHIENTGYRLQQTAGQAIATAYSTLTGVTWVFCEGWLIGKKR
jgi:hypothetical protein